METNALLCIFAFCLLATTNTIMRTEAQSVFPERYAELEKCCKDNGCPFGMLDGPQCVTHFPKGCICVAWDNDYEEDYTSG